MSEIKEQLITPDVIENAMDYEEYRQLIDDLLEKDKTTGDNHSEQMVQYTKMNVHRMNRIDKQVNLSEEISNTLEQVEEDWIWLVLTEGWCGDAAQNVPVIARMAEQSDHIDLRFILRDEHLDIIDEYLTNGGRSIPKLICLRADDLEELGTWGPRPEVIQKKAMEWKDNPGISKQEWAEKLHKWYAEDKGHEVQSEFAERIPKWDS